MTTRQAVLVLLGRRPGSTVAELAAELSLSGKAVRRHLDLLAEAGLVHRVAAARHGAGRPAAGWGLTADGSEALPRAYDRLAFDLLDDLADELGPAGVDAVLARRRAKLADQYRESLNGASTLADRVQGLARLRDADGYLASWYQTDEGLGLVEHNCSVAQAAARQPAICSMELSLFREVLGPGVEVERADHLLDGDTCCCYRIRPLG